MICWMFGYSEASNTKELSVAFFCDLKKKSFDCVDHSILFFKTKQMGIMDGYRYGTELAWFIHCWLTRYLTELSLSQLTIFCSTVES